LEEQHVRILPIQDVYARRFARQSAIEELEYHASGHCVHIEKLSPGCQACFEPTEFSYNIRTGPQCNANCVYCPGTGKEKPREYLDHIVAEMYTRALLQDHGDTIPRVSFSGGGEPLMYLETIEDVMTSIQSIVAKGLMRKPWVHVYTNGLLAGVETVRRLADLGVDELRFHVGASGFSKQVFANIEAAAGQMRAIAVETPAWPPHRSKLFEMLPVIEDMGVRHLNLGEVMLCKENYGRVSSILPDGEIYQCYELHLHDGGLVYDIVEEVLSRGYSYSVLDCSSFVKAIQRGPGKWVAHEDVAGLCADYSASHDSA
jgi:pyruvate formate-lyase activating enzyme-like uncharacterized protein